MSKYFTKNGRAYITESMIRSENPNSRIPDPMTDAHAISLGYQVQEPTLDELAEQARSEFKSTRQAAVESIVVTTSLGRAFDGDEVSQNRMARAIVAMQAANVDSTPWVLADNTPVTVSATELAEALALAGAAQSALWVMP